MKRSSAKQNGCSGLPQVICTNYHFFFADGLFESGDYYRNGFYLRAPILMLILPCTSFLPQNLNVIILPGMVHCAHCGPDPQANAGNSDRVFTTRVSQKRGGRRLSRQKAWPSCDSWIEELAWFVAPSIAAWASLRSLSGGHCDERDLVVGNIFQDR